MVQESSTVMPGTPETAKRTKSTRNTTTIQDPCGQPHSLPLVCSQLVFGFSSTEETRIFFGRVNEACHPSEDKKTKRDTTLGHSMDTLTFIRIRIIKHSFESAPWTSKES
jgi:hypothetical protein